MPESGDSIMFRAVDEQLYHNQITYVFQRTQ